jgi:hypothetical protein
MKHPIGILILLLAGCGSVSEAGAPTMIAAGGASGEDAPGPDAGSGGSVGGAADAGSDAGACAPPVLPVSWTITNLDTLASMTCADLGISSLIVRFDAIARAVPSLPFQAVVPCGDGTGSVPLKNLPPGSGFSYSYGIIINAPSFNTDQRAAWARSTRPNASSMRGGTYDSSKCGVDAAGISDVTPFQIVVGTPPSCAPCVQADACCHDPKGLGTPAGTSCTTSSTGQPSTFAATCEGNYGDARDVALSACVQFSHDLSCP